MGAPQTPDRLVVDEPIVSGEPTVAQVVALVRGTEPDADARFDPGSWGLLLVPVLTGIGLCLAMLFVG